MFCAYLVVGVKLQQEKIRHLLQQLGLGARCFEPEYVCYLLDDGGFVIYTSDEYESLEVSIYICFH